MSGLVSLFRRPAAAPVATLPRGVRAYAVGDVHGRDDLLAELLARIEADIAARGRARNVIVFLGDLIDRGPASAQVIERLRGYRRPGIRTVFLSGNHEEVLLRLLAGDCGLLSDWLQFGGAECVASYGLQASRLKRMRPGDAVERLRQAIPREHRQFLEAMADTFSAGSYLFVHAGVRPGIALEEQAQTDLRWIRQPFLGHEGDHGFVVVHGHTISEEVEIRPNRIGLDTGAYRSGVLSAVGIEGAERWVLQSLSSEAFADEPRPSRLASSGRAD